MDRSTAGHYMEDVPGWSLSLDGLKIFRDFEFKNFVEAIAFVNKVADIANQEDHHPDISINYSKVEITLWTHAIGGLSENDFILASKINEIPVELKK